MDQNKQKVAPQWLGRDIVHPDDAHHLEVAAAIHEFGPARLPRHEAEEKAHAEYVKTQREKAAAHHLQGMRLAQVAGDEEAARKHWVMYDLHTKALGHSSVGLPDPSIERHLKSEDKPKGYRFKVHKADLYATHPPSADKEEMEKSEKEFSAPEAAVEILKAVADLAKAISPIRVALPAQPNHPAVQQARLRAAFKHVGTGKVHVMPSWHDPDALAAQIGRPGDSSEWDPTADGYQDGFADQTGKFYTREEAAQQAGHQGKFLESTDYYRGVNDGVFKSDEGLSKAERKKARQCKWRLGERRCKRIIGADYCHHHVNHWANRIKQDEPKDPETEK